MDLMNLFSVTVTPKGKLPQITYICDNYSFDGNMLYLTMGQDESYVIPRENILFYSVSRVQAKSKEKPAVEQILDQKSPTVSMSDEEYKNRDKEFPCS